MADFPYVEAVFWVAVQVERGMIMKIRGAKQAELEKILEKYKQARDFMRVHGNPDQWGDSYPPRELVERDIQEGNLYVGEQDGEIVSVFFYQTGDDPTYDKIYGGQWLNCSPYGVVHRIVSDGTVKGAASQCIQWAYEQCGNLKIDTHRDNLVMQKLLEKNGFTLCGNIFVEDGSERIAYQKK